MTRIFLCDLGFVNNLNFNLKLIFFKFQLHEQECKILTNSGQTWDSLPISVKCGGNWDNELPYRYISLIRALLLPTDKLEELLSLPVLLPQIAFDGVRLVKMAVDFAFDSCKLGVLASKTKMRKVFTTIMANQTSTPRFYDTKEKRLVSLILGDGPTGRILPHSCIPNREMYVDPFKGFSASFKTIRKVKLKNNNNIPLHYICFQSYITIPNTKAKFENIIIIKNQKHIKSIV